MARKTKEDALVTRDRILDAAELVFEQRGVSRCSLQEIAQAAGQGKPRLSSDQGHGEATANLTCETHCIAQRKARARDGPWAGSAMTTDRAALSAE